MFIRAHIATYILHKCDTDVAITVEWVVRNCERKKLVKLIKKGKLKALINWSRDWYFTHQIWSCEDTFRGICNWNDGMVSCDIKPQPQNLLAYSNIMNSQYNSHLINSHFKAFYKDHYTFVIHVYVSKPYWQCKYSNRSENYRFGSSLLLFINIWTCKWHSHPPL